MPPTYDASDDMDQTERIQEAAQHVFDVMAKRVGPEDLQRIKDAYALAAEAHKDQKRNTGEPYIVHPIAVANIAAEELELDANTVIAAFLHDVAEDTSYTVEDIRERFGDDVAFLVDVVTKRKKHNYEYTKQVDNYRQILESVHYDIRALLVKLSDRLHNMRTLDSMRPDKQMKIAGETDFFYAPLAGRLGLYHVKTELENLSFRFRCPREYDVIFRQLEEDKIRTQSAVDDFTAEINEIFKTVGIPARTQVRYRKPYSIWRTMREEGCDFAHVDFKHFVRIIYNPIDEWLRSQSPEKDTSLFIYSCLSGRFKERPGSVVNYIDNPKDNGYQSFHVQLLNRAGAWEEMHIASERMHRNSRLGCIVERGESWLERFKTVLQNIADSGDGYIFMDGVSSCTTTYSTWARVARASSELYVIERLRMWHDPHTLFNRRMLHVTPGSHRRAAQSAFSSPSRVRRTDTSASVQGTRAAWGRDSAFARIFCTHRHLERRNSSPSFSVAHHFGTDRCTTPSFPMRRFMRRMRLRSTKTGTPRTSLSPE